MVANCGVELPFSYRTERVRRSRRDISCRIAALLVPRVCAVRYFAQWRVAWSVPRVRGASGAW